MYTLNNAELFMSYQIWTNLNVGIKMSFKKLQLNVKVEVGLILNF